MLGKELSSAAVCWVCSTVGHMGLRHAAPACVLFLLF